MRIENRSDSNYYRVYQKTKKITHGVYDEMACVVKFEVELKKQFFKLIQLLSFIRTLEYSRQFINDQAYYVLEFSVMDFISFTGSNTKSTYQRTKALEFLTSLQDLKPLIQKFSDNEFRRSVMFPYLKLTKQNRRCIITMKIEK